MTTPAINSTAYWDRRFAGGDWEQVGGPQQTRDFAEAQCKRFRLPRVFSGTLLDFGCGMGDAFPVYRAFFPKARLRGMDISEAAIQACIRQYGEWAQFDCGDYTRVPPSDVVVVSNVLEHLPDDVDIVRHLITRCRWLYVTVPYRESPRIPEHIRSYGADAFDDLKPCRKTVFSCRGWTLQEGFWETLWQIYTKNAFRALMGRPCVQRRLQILFQFEGKA